MIDKRLLDRIIKIFRTYYVIFYASYLLIFIFLNYFLETFLSQFTTVSADFYFDSSTVYNVTNSLTAMLILILCSYIYLLKRSFMFMIPRKDFIVTLLLSIFVFSILVIATEVIISIIMGAALDPLGYINLFIIINYACTLLIFICLLFPYIHNRFTSQSSIIVYILMGLILFIFIPYVLGELRGYIPEISEVVGNIYIELLFVTNYNLDKNVLTTFVISPGLIGIIPVLYGIKKLYLTTEY